MQLTSHIADSRAVSGYVLATDNKGGGDSIWDLVPASPKAKGNVEIDTDDLQSIPFLKIRQPSIWNTPPPQKKKT